MAKSPVIPFRKYVYYIDKTNGLTFESIINVSNILFALLKKHKFMTKKKDEYQSYEGTNPSFQNIKIKPYLN